MVSNLSFTHVRVITFVAYLILGNTIFLMQV